MSRITFALLVAALLAGCSTPPATRHQAQIAQAVQAPDPCAKYKDPTDFGRCRLFRSADGWRYIPEIGRSADLETQIRCAPFRPDLDFYTACIGRAAGTQQAAAPAAVAVEPAAGLVSRPPIRVEPLEPEVTVARPNPAYSSRSSEELDAALQTWTPQRVRPTAPADANLARTIPRAPPAPSTWTAPRVEPTAPPTVARTIPKAPTVAKPEQSTRGWPLCAENGSCYGDISSYTGRPKTVHVKGYYRKDGTYVRGHYRSRPRW